MTERSIHLDDLEILSALANPSGSIVRKMSTPWCRPEEPEKWHQSMPSRGTCWHTNVRHEEVRKIGSKELISERTYTIPLREWLTRICPFGIVGDRLWVKETWRPWLPNIIQYRVGENRVEFPAFICESITWDGLRWRPYPQMPRWAARLIFTITSADIEWLSPSDSWQYRIHYLRTEDQPA